MIYDAKAFKRKTSFSTTTHVGKATFTAENEIDAVQLAALFWAMTEGHPLITQFRKEALEAYCDKNNLTIRATT